MGVYKRKKLNEEGGLKKEKEKRVSLRLWEKGLKHTRRKKKKKQRREAGAPRRFSLTHILHHQLHSSQAQKRCIII